MNLNNIIAGNLKRLRNERQLSLSKLSDICGVSKVMLGQIERGESNPTINTIWKIAGGLRVPYTSLIDEPIKNDILIKKKILSTKNLPIINIEFIAILQAIQIEILSFLL